MTVSETIGLTMVIVGSVGLVITVIRTCVARHRLQRMIDDVRGGLHGRR